MARIRNLPVGLLSLLLATATAYAEDEFRPVADEILKRDDEIDELKRQVAVLVDEVSSLRTQMGVPAEPEFASVFGLGPAASKIYGTARGLSIGGYAEAVYRNRVGDASGDGEDFADFIRTVIYVGHKFNERLLFNTEVEFEHASTAESGSVSIEFASLEYLLMDELNLRAGLLLLPMGFLNEIHEPPFYYGTQRPSPERRIIPSTWRENGVGIFGNLSEDVVYRVYLVNGLDASGFTSSGLRGGRQKGSEVKAEDIAVVARLDVSPMSGLSIGGAFYQGNSGQDQVDGTTGIKLPSARTRIWEVHAEWESGPFHTRGLFTHASVGDAGKLSSALGLTSGQPVAEEMLGGYFEAAYDVMSLIAPSSEKSLTPFFRFEYVDTQHEIPLGFTRDRSQPRRLFIPGIQYKPHPNVVLKLDYRNIDTWGTNTADELSVGFGLVF